MKNSSKKLIIKKGFAMLFSVLVSSLVLSVGLSIFSLTLKELILSASGRESQFAFYAADSGAECALYWDIKGSNIFATSTSLRTQTPSNPACNLQDITDQTINSINVGTSHPYGTYKDPDSAIDSGRATTQFMFTMTNPNSSSAYCAIVTVFKETINGILSTTIDSRGYNTCDVSDKSRVERGLRVKY